MKKCIVILLIALLVACSQPAEPTKKTAAPETEIILPGKFEDLPINIQNRLLTLFDNEQPANSIESFNSTDVIEENTSSRRVIFTQQEKEMTFVYYEHGGIGLHNHLVGFYSQDNEANPVLNVSLKETHKTLAHVRVALSKIEFANANEY